MPLTGGGCYASTDKTMSLNLYAEVLTPSNTRNEGSERQLCEAAARGGCLHVKQGALRKNQSYQHLDLELLASGSVRKEASVVQVPPFCGILSWKPSQTNIGI